MSEAAAELGLVPNTASTLVTKLAADGLLIRTVDADDRRVGRLRLTEPAQHIADESRAARRARWPRCSTNSTPTQIDRLEGGLAVLARDDADAAGGDDVTTDRLRSTAAT